MSTHDHDSHSDIVRYTGDELRDIHRKIDTLEKESERQFSSLTEKLHALEVAVVRGNRFPPGAWVAAAALLLGMAGQAGLVYSKLELTTKLASDAFNAIRSHITEMAPAEKMVYTHDERIKSLESRIVGQGPEGWHRRDHDTYARMVEAQMGALSERVQRTEDAQAAVCQRVQACGGKR